MESAGWNLYHVILVLEALILAYFLVHESVHLLLLIIGGAATWREAVRGRYKAYPEELFEDWPGITVVIPAYNEGSKLLETVEAALASRYPGELEVVVVDDGSTDGTLELIAEAWDLVPEQLRPQPDATEKVTVLGRIVGLYRSARDRRLLVIRKENMLKRKADAVNAGLRYVRTPYVVIVDGDSRIDGDGLRLLMRHVACAEDPVLVAGGVVRPANGTVWGQGILREIRLPDSLLERVQVVEYLRAFFYGRRGLAAFGALPLVSGAFALYRRSVLVEAGGVPTDAVGEDLETYIKMALWARKRFKTSGAVFATEPVVWTRIPASWRRLWRQRVRWHAGLLQALWRYRAVIANPRYGSLGCGAMVYLPLFEAGGPVMEVVGYATSLLAMLSGALDWFSALAWFLVAAAVHMLNSVGAIILSDTSLRRYRRSRDVLNLVVAAVFEQVGYRQFTLLARLWAGVQLLAGGLKGRW